MGQGPSGSSKPIIASHRATAEEQSQIHADPVFRPYGVPFYDARDHACFRRGAGEEALCAEPAL
jgi:hypothetical protein